jgi:hypothetical protein
MEGKARSGSPKGEICNQCHPNLYFDGIGALSVEVSQWEVLLELLEK